MEWIRDVQVEIDRKFTLQSNTTWTNHNNDNFRLDNMKNVQLIHCIQWNRYTHKNISITFENLSLNCDDVTMITRITRDCKYFKIVIPLSYSRLTWPYINIYAPIVENNCLVIGNVLLLAFVSRPFQSSPNGKL